MKAKVIYCFGFRFKNPLIKNCFVQIIERVQKGLDVSGRAPTPKKVYKDMLNE